MMLGNNQTIMIGFNLVKPYGSIVVEHMERETNAQMIVFTRNKAW